jgi:hypothetical protein
MMFLANFCFQRHGSLLRTGSGSLGRSHSRHFLLPNQEVLENSLVPIVTACFELDHILVTSVRKILKRVWSTNHVVCMDSVAWIGRQDC